MQTNDWNDSYYYCEYPSHPYFLYESDAISEEDISRYKFAKEWVEELVYQLYEAGNVECISIAAQELAAILNVKVPDGDLKIKKIENNPQ